MTDPSTPPRFRVRLEGGQELPVSTVEALGHRLVRGELLPDTPVYDASTGLWVRASDSPVVRFVLEELARESGEVPPGWPRTPRSRVSDSPPENWAVRAGRREEGMPELELESLLEDPSEPDTGAGPPGEWSEFALTLVEPPQPGGSAAPRTSTEALEPPEAVNPVPSVREGAPDAAGDDRLPEWVAPREARPPEPVARSREPVARTDHRTMVDKHGPSRALLYGGVLAGVVATALVVLSQARVGTDPGDTAGRTPSLDAGTGPFLAAPPEPPPVPEGLGPAVEVALAAFAGRMGEVVDSLGVVHGLGTAPPSPWLGGAYLAGASGFPEVREFWDSYHSLIDELRGRERETFQVALAEVDPVLPPEGSDRARLEGYLEERLAEVAPWRSERYLRLEDVAESAIQLHDFLVTSEEHLRFTPAIGAAVPRDPVLEVGTDDPEVLRALNEHLDGLFRTLDRSRVGGVPSPDGLASELFLEFGIL